jgi:hypothetical protein
MNAEEIIIKAEDPHSLEAVQLINELSACLQSITGDGGQSSFNVEDVCIPRSLFAIARTLKNRRITMAGIRAGMKPCALKRCCCPNRLFLVAKRAVCHSRNNIGDGKSYLPPDI